MKWIWKIVTCLAVLTLVFVIGGFGYVIKAKYTMNEYVLQLGAAFNAATIVNAEETHTDASAAVIASYQGKQAVMVPENYKALQSYLRRDYAMPLYARIERENALHISICGQSHLYIVSDRDGQGATILMESAGKSFKMHVTGGDLWDKIVEICMNGRSKYPNIPM